MSVRVEREGEGPRKSGGRPRVGEVPMWILGFVERGVSRLRLCRGGGGLVEVEVEVEVFLGVYTCRSNGRRGCGESEVGEDFLEHLDVGDHRHDDHLSSAVTSHGVYAEQGVIPTERLSFRPSGCHSDRGAGAAGRRGGICEKPRSYATRAYARSLDSHRSLGMTRGRTLESVPLR